MFRDAKNYPFIYIILSVAFNAGGLIGEILNIVADMDIHLVMFQFRHYICQEVNVAFYYVLISVLP